MHGKTKASRVTRPDRRNTELENGNARWGKIHITERRLEKRDKNDKLSFLSMKSALPQTA